jgi:uncharacterized protein
MPEYLAPGVQVEEVSSRARFITGVATSVAGFVGPSRFGPVDRASPPITSYAEFERLYGDAAQLAFTDAGPTVHFLAHAVRAFFVEGGRKLFVSRVFAPTDAVDPWNGRARGTVAAPSGALELRARFPGSGGNGRVSFTVVRGPNLLGGTAPAPTVTGLVDRDVVWIGPRATGSHGTFYLARHDPAQRSWSFVPNNGAAATGTLILAGLSPDVHALRVVTASVAVAASAGAAPGFARTGLPLDPAHRKAGREDSLFAAFASLSDDEAVRDTPLVIGHPGGAQLDNGLSVLALLLDAPAPTGSPLPRRSRREAIEDPGSGDAERTLTVELTGGHDGRRPQAADIAGRADAATRRAWGLAQFERIEDIAIVAAPGASFGMANEPWRSSAEAVAAGLLRHCEAMRYRVAVIDCGNGQSLQEVRALRAKLDSKYGALYYPWVRVARGAGAELLLPPSGFVAGIYARVDAERGVFKAPANEAVRSATGFEAILSKAQQETLNPEGINCLRSFDDRGHLVWGARTVSSDPEWKYINVRRYFCYLQRSIDKGTQWAVFEPNGEALWMSMRQTIDGFLVNEWKRGALQGALREQAYFTRCDRTTMTQSDIDNGRVVCEIGIARIKAAEFMVFRIGQWTTDRKV